MAGEPTTVTVDTPEKPLLQMTETAAAITEVRRRGLESRALTTLPLELRRQLLHALMAALPDSKNLKSNDVCMPVVPMFHANGWSLAFSTPMMASTGSGQNHFETNASGWSPRAP